MPNAVSILHNNVMIFQNGLLKLPFGEYTQEKVDGMFFQHHISVYLIGLIVAN